MNTWYERVKAEQLHCNSENVLIVAFSELSHLFYLKKWCGWVVNCQTDARLPARPHTNAHIHTRLQQNKHKVQGHNLHEHKNRPVYLYLTALVVNWHRCEIWGIHNETISLFLSLSLTRQCPWFDHFKKKKYIFGRNNKYVNTSACPHHRAVTSFPSQTTNVTNSSNLFHNFYSAVFWRTLEWGGFANVQT